MTNEIARLTAERDDLRQQLEAVLGENDMLCKIISSITDEDNQPHYSDAGMGCGIEDHYITDRYEACRYGWNEAIERVYNEVISRAVGLDLSNTKRMLAERDRDMQRLGVEKFIARMKTLPEKYEHLISADMAETFLQIEFPKSCATEGQP